MNTTPDDDERRKAESAAILRRVEQDSETVFSSSMARIGRRASDHFTAADAHDEAGGTADPIELWGRRIGRVLSLAGVIVLAYLLGQTLGYW